VNATTLLTIIGSCLAVGTAIGAIISNLRKGNKEQQSEVIQLQQNEIAAFKSSNERLEKDKAALVAENAQLVKSNKDLKDIAQQTPEIKKLIKIVSELVTAMGASQNAKRS